MSQNLTISETGLKLIKAFEGYRPVDRELITGQRIVGYGHRLYSEDAVMMNKGEAEETLRSDLAPFEDMINSEVHAPVTQSQFDALCSFAFNIGPKAFLTSDTLRALNNGRPLDAANGLDIWRKSEIAGKTYVVDALMRRRTAEKALFLRTERNLPAGREDLPPVRDTTIASLSTEDALPVFTAEDANGIVATAPHDAAIVPMRRREDGPAGALELSELDVVPDDAEREAKIISISREEIGSDLDVVSADQDDVIQAFPTQSPDLDLSSDLLADVPSADFDIPSEDDYEGLTEETRPSPIAAAATDIVARLDALIEDADAGFEDREADWPESLITSEVAEIEKASSPEKQNTDATKPSTDKSDDKVVQLGRRHRRRRGLADVDRSAPVEPQPAIKPVMLIDELTQDDAFRVRTDSAAKYIKSIPPVQAAIPAQDESALGLWIPVILGFLLLGLAGGTMISGAEALLGDWGPIITFVGLVIGAGLILAGVYAALRTNLRS